MQCCLCSCFKWKLKYCDSEQCIPLLILLTFTCYVWYRVTPPCHSFGKTETASLSTRLFFELRLEACSQVLSEFFPVMLTTNKMMTSKRYSGFRDFSCAKAVLDSIPFLLSLCLCKEMHKPILLCLNVDQDCSTEDLRTPELPLWPGRN